jgi:hypothetical protein
MSSNQKLAVSGITNFTVPIIIGVILTCILNMLVNYFGYDETIVKIDKNVDKYDTEIPVSDVSEIKTSNKLMWSLIPSTLTLLIWVGIIWYITKPKTEDSQESDSSDL